MVYIDNKLKRLSKGTIFKGVFLYFFKIVPLFYILIIFNIWVLVEASGKLESEDIFMDKIDKKLITLLQQNARMPLKALAENVF